MEPFFKLLLSVLLCHVALSHQKVSATPVYGISETSSNSSFLDQPLLEPRKEKEDETAALESPVAVGLERANTTAESLSRETENGKMLSELERTAATAETLSSKADDAKTHNDVGKVDGHRSPKLEYLAARVQQRGTTSPIPFRGLRRRKEGQAPLGETEREGARGAAGTRRWFEENPRISISVDAPGYVQRRAAKVSSHVMDADDPGQVEAVYALGRSDNSGLFAGQRSPYSSSRGRSLANQLPGSGLYSRYYNQNGFNPNYGSGTRQSSRDYLPESDLSLLFEKLLKVEEDLSRLKETVLLQGSVHIRTSQRLESFLVRQLRVGLQSNQDSAKMLRKIEQCCRCSVPGRDADDLESDGTPSQTVRDRAFNVTSSQRGRDAVSNVTSSPAAAVASASYVTSRQREPLELMSKVKSPQRASAETRNHTRDDKSLREQERGVKDSTRQENKSSAVFSTASTQASPADPSLQSYSVDVPIGTMLFHSTPTTLSESASEVKISITETTVISGTSASEISSERDSTDKGNDGKVKSKKQPDEEKAKSREEEEKHDSESDEDDESDEEEKEDDAEEKGDSDSDESIENDEKEEGEKDDNQKSNQLKKSYAVEDDDDKEQGNNYGEGDNNKDETQNGGYAGGDNVGGEKHRKLNTYAGSDDKTNRSKSQMDDFKPVEDGEFKRGEMGKQESESRTIPLSTNGTLQDYSSNKSQDDAGEYDSDKDKSVIAADDATLRGSPFDSANATVDDLNFTAVTAGHIANLTETTDPSVSSKLSTESLDVILKMTTLPVASRGPGRGDDVILTEKDEDKGENYELDSRVDANRVTVANIVVVHDASTSGNVNATTQRTHDASQNNQARQGSNTNAAEPVFFVDGGKTVSVETSAGGEANTAAVTGTQDIAAEANFLRRNHTPSVDHRNAQPAKGDGMSNASSTVTKDALDGTKKVNDGKANGHGHTQSDEANNKVGRKDVVAEPAATHGDEKDRKGDRNAGKVRGSTSDRELTTTPRSAYADPLNFEPSALTDSNFTVPAVSTTIAIPATDVAENTTAATWRSPPAGKTTATRSASRPSTPTDARVATTRWSPRLPFTTTAAITTATTIPTSTTTRSRGSRTQSISAGSKSASAEPDKPSLEVDLSAGTIKGDMLPGVTWAAPLHIPRNITSRRARERNRRGKRQIFPSCSFQGVLKFTFTPPGQGSPRLPTRYYQPRGRFQITRQGPESSGTAGNGSRRELELDLWFQNPKSWVFNLGDSIANNGYSGDGAVQENDCEVQGYGTNFAVYGSDKHPNVRQKLLQAKRNFIYDRITLVVSDQTIFWNNHRGESASLRDPSLFALAGQSDSQGDVNYDVYLGLNRVIDGDYRSGQGLCRLVVKWLK